MFRCAKHKDISNAAEVFAVSCQGHYCPLNHGFSFVQEHMPHLPCSLVLGFSLLNYADNGSPLVSRPAVGAYGLLRELQTGTMTPFTICAASQALNFTRTGTLLCHLLLDLSPMSDCQSQSLSSSVHLSKPLSIL